MSDIDVLGAFALSDSVADALPTWAQQNSALKEKLKSLGTTIQKELPAHRRVSLATESQVERILAVIRTILGLRTEYFSIDAAEFAAMQALRGLQHECDQLVARHKDEDATQYGSVADLLEQAVGDGDDASAALQALRESVEKRMSSRYEQGRADFVGLHRERTDLANYKREHIKNSAGNWWPVTRKHVAPSKNNVDELANANASALAGWEIDHLRALALEQLQHLDAQIGQGAVGSSANKRVLLGHQVTRKSELRRIAFLTEHAIPDYQRYISSARQAFETRRAVLAARQVQLVGELSVLYATLRESARRVFGYKDLPPVFFPSLFDKGPDKTLADILQAVTSLASYLDERALRSYECNVRIPVTLRSIMNQKWIAQVKPHEAAPAFFADGALLRGIAVQSADGSGGLVLSMHFPDVFVPDPPSLGSTAPAPETNPTALLLATVADAPREAKDFHATSILWNHSGRGTFLFSVDKLAPGTSTDLVVWMRCVRTIAGNA